MQKRMTIDDYKRNLRGVNDGKDFDPAYLVGAIDATWLMIGCHP